jgi:ABC-2 type transport system ATP-binding protein
MTTATVSVSSICKRFGDLLAVDDVSFEVYPGEIFGLLGPNGAGKTTTIRMMLDIFRPDCGLIRVFGGALDDLAKKRVGYLPEERGLYRDLKLDTVLIYLATLKGLSQAEARRRLEAWLQRLDLWEHRHKRVQDLSRGMQQKAQLVATLVHEPDLIVVDEPFSGLDPINVRLVIGILEEQRRAGRTIIMSTHQMHQVEALCNRIVLIDRGRSVLYGEVNQIKRDFSGHALVLQGQGELGSLPGVLEIRQQNGEYHLPLETGADPQAVLRALADAGTFRIERFALAQPSLDDIFIGVVQGAAHPSPTVSKTERG